MAQSFRKRCNPVRRILLALARRRRSRRLQAAREKRVAELQVKIKRLEGLQWRDWQKLASNREALFVLLQANCPNPLKAARIFSKLKEKMGEEPRFLLGSVWHCQQQLDALQAELKKLKGKEKGKK